MYRSDLFPFLSRMLLSETLARCGNCGDQCGEWSVAMTYVVIRDEEDQDD